MCIGIVDFKVHREIPDTNSPIIFFLFSSSSTRRTAKNDLRNLAGQKNVEPGRLLVLII